MIVSTFLKYGRKNLLTHPLVETFIHLKWISSSVFFYINILLYLLYLLSFTILADWTATMKYDFPKNSTSTEGADREDDTIMEYCGRDIACNIYVWFFLYIFCVVCLLIFTFREIVQFHGGGWRYIKSSENKTEVMTLVCTWIYIVIVPTKMGFEWEQIFAAIAVFCAWIEMTLMIGRVPSIGIFTFMMFKVVHQVIKFFFVYATTLIAFALAFHLLLIRDEDSDGNGVFDAFWPSFLKVS